MTSQALAVMPLGPVSSAEHGTKRQREASSLDSADAAGGVKYGKVSHTPAVQQPSPPVVDPSVNEGSDQECSNSVLNPYPFFYYTDHSTVSDSDSLTPLTAPGRVPNFPAKMHAILSRSDIEDIVCWLPHGRAWRVFKPREFEVKVLPTYFEHAKFSSFIRQANGWGFRRVTQGRDRNAYYHERFLRGLPHLCKDMKRPRVAEKPASCPDHEPDFYKISELHPVPEKPADESILLQCTLQGGPKARMPVYSGLLSLKSEQSSSDHEQQLAAPKAQLTPSDCESLASFQSALGASENQMKNLDISLSTKQSVQEPLAALPTASLASLTRTAPVNLSASSVPSKLTALATANQLAFPTPTMVGSDAAFQAPIIAPEFAAGFAAAMALSQQQFRSMLDSFAMSLASGQGVQPSQPHGQMLRNTMT